MNRQQLIQTLVPLLYDIKPKTPKRSSYAIKHDLEHAIFHEDGDRFYFTNSEVIATLVEMGIPHTAGEPNYGFALKPKFDLFVFFRNRPPAEKPKGMYKRHWDAYLTARDAMNELVNDLTKHDTSDSSPYTKLAKVVGYHS